MPSLRYSGKQVWATWGNDCTDLRKSFASLSGKPALMRLWMEVGVEISGASSSIASFSIISKPSQNCCVVGDASLDVVLFFFSDIRFCFHSSLSLVEESLFLSLWSPGRPLIRSLEAPRLPSGIHRRWQSLKLVCCSCLCFVVAGFGFECIFFFDVFFGVLIDVCPLV